ncbi:MAG: sugar phosphate isomerase/epimerase [Bacteroidales bacterium]|nr:sugar phosphate isomerase/epimerase [Bacteroidales bacterium]
MITEKNSFTLGISSWTYPWAVGLYGEERAERKLGAVGLMKKAVALGVTLVQFADNLPLENLSDDELAELKGFAVDFGLSIEVGTKGIDPPHLLNMLRIARYLESPLLRILPAIFGRKAEMAELEESIRAVLPEFERSEITIVLENTEAFTAEEYSALVNRVDNSRFRLCVDLANAIGRLEGPHYVIDLLAPYCANYHFKDVKVTRSKTLMGFSVEGTVSGQGSIPLDYSVAQLKKSNLWPSVIIELWPPRMDTMSETIHNENNMATASVMFMRDYLKKVNSIT